MPLVDILLATLGVFIVVLASQELVDDIPMVEVPADAALICRSAQEVSLIFPDPDRAALTLATDNLATHLTQALPLGGNLVVAIPDSCTHGSPSGFQHLLALDSALTASAAKNIFFRFRFVPVGDGAFGPDALAAALINKGSWPPAEQVR